MPPSVDAPATLVLKTVTEHEQQPQDRVFVLAQEVTRLGRAADSDVVLDDPQVSRRHAQIELKYQRCVLRDLNSRNGTFVNGRCIDGSAVLSNKDLITIGPFRLQFLDPEGTVVKGQHALKIDHEHGEVFVRGEKVALTPKEYDLLRLLAARPGVVVERSEIAMQVWHEEKPGLVRQAIDTTVTNLRKKLEQADPSVQIMAVRERGYRLLSRT